ncbi:helix-turn-helix transcriptional regulator [Bacillus sp. AFS040349]|uniref:helix-turn-helix transcriptional regulator n=1 Tax=Bacillus sp. AFS040349 TaxID=2033502 RepID=UPI000BFE54AB|nr:helix-turn-helix transcriptional regulator [Bacillus sp. AFS040349]PGT89235.1 transcriptional regulator [Bacillus sp. AFS040349]
MIVNKIGRLANEKGIKHKYLAKECGVSIQTFSRWVNNHTQPDLIQSVVIAKILGVQIEELVEIEGETQ